MAENVEDIEAKLAAYVDGELTPAERVEIETHLQANPSHRALLQDLVRHRNLLRALPREKAPGDCTEGFQGQLERDILLGGDELSKARRRWRIQYSPQLLSAAAIILVAVALAIIVYSVLPPHQPRAPIAQLTTEPARNEAPVADSSTAFAEGRSSKAVMPEVLAKKAGGNGSLTLNQDSLAQQLETTRFGGYKTQSQETLAAGDMMVITITADDVKSANDAVVNYLALNKINYTDAAQDALQDGLVTLAAGGRVAAAGMPAGGSGAYGDGAIGGNAGMESARATQTPALRTNLDDVAKRDANSERKREVPEKDDLNVAFKSAAPREQPVAEQTVAAADEPQREERFFKTGAQPSPAHPEAKAPSTQPTALAANDTRGVNEALHSKLTQSTAGSVSAGTLVLRQQQVRAVQQLADQEGAACVILARNMNGQQVRELAQSLSQPERNLYARVQLERADAYRQNALVALDRSSDKDQKEHFLSYERQPVQENEVLLREKVVAANAPAIAGPITRPSEPLATLAIKPAEAGITRSEGDAGGRINVANNATPSNFSLQGAQQPLAPAQQQQTYLALAPTTQPDANRGRGDLFTCVILVQNTGSARAAIPSTQPTQTIAGKPTTAPSATPAPPAADQAK